MADTWGGKDNSISGPAGSAVAIDLSSTDATLGYVSRGIYVGGAGDVKVDMAGPQAGTVTFSAVPAGTLLPIRVSKVYKTGTTATLLIAVW